MVLSLKTWESRSSPGLPRAVSRTSRFRLSPCFARRPTRCRGSFASGASSFAQTALWVEPLRVLKSVPAFRSLSSRYRGSLRVPLFHVLALRLRDTNRRRVFPAAVFVLGAPFGIAWRGFPLSASFYPLVGIAMAVWRRHSPPGVETPNSPKRGRDEDGPCLIALS